MNDEVDKSCEEETKNEIVDFIEKKGPIEKDCIEGELDLSSPKLEKCLEELQEEGWVKQDQEKYRTPEKGEQVNVKAPAYLQKTLQEIGMKQKRLMAEAQSAVQAREEFLNQMRIKIKGIDVGIPDETVKNLKNLGKASEQFYMKLNTTFPALERYNQINQRMIDQMTPVLQNWQNAINKVKAQIPDLLPTLPNLKQALEEIPDDLREANEKLVPHGWVFSPSMPMNIINFVNENEDVEEIIDELVEDYFTDDTCKRLLDDCLEHHLFEKREEPLSEAFENHKDGRYYSSIPVFLAQADGAYMDTFGKYEYFFSGQEDNIELTSDLPFDEALIDGINQLLYEELAPKSEDIDDESALNRHVVQHGIWSGYGTKENSVKAIVLLDFARFIIERQEEAEENEDNEED